MKSFNSWLSMYRLHLADSGQSKEISIANRRSALFSYMQISSPVHLTCAKSFSLTCKFTFSIF